MVKNASGYQLLLGGTCEKELTVVILADAEPSSNDELSDNLPGY